MSPKDLRKICHLEAKMLDNLVNCAQRVRQTGRRSRLDVEVTPLPVGQLAISIVEDSRMNRLAGLKCAIEVWSLAILPLLYLTQRHLMP